MAQTLICLVRHGQTNWNKEFRIQGRYDIPLNDEGRKQIKNTANRLSNTNIKWDVFLSSPLSRAYETCEIICKDLGYKNYEIITRPNLIEREFGVADGLEISDDVYNKILNDDYEGMELSSDMQNRAINELYEIAKLYKNKNILITTHSHYIKGVFTVLDKSLTFRSTLNNGGLNYIIFEDDKIIKFEFNK